MVGSRSRISSRVDRLVFVVIATNVPPWHETLGESRRLWQIRTARDSWARAPPSRARVRGLVPCDSRLSSGYGVVNWCTSLFTPSLLPLLSIDVTV
jgi:hypothetical protein